MLTSAEPLTGSEPAFALAKIPAPHRLIEANFRYPRWPIPGIADDFGLIYVLEGRLHPFDRQDRRPNLVVFRRRAPSPGRCWRRLFQDADRQRHRRRRDHRRACRTTSADANRPWSTRLLVVPKEVPGRRSRRWINSAESGFGALQQD
jgi:hypothetical protein